MSKTPKPQEILSTMNYDMFKLRHSNRNIADGRVDARIESLDDLDLSYARPVIINEHNEIIEGQHMFEACKRSNRPIYYIRAVLKNRSDDAMQLLNTHQRAWTQVEWINHWVKRGKEDYKLVIDCAMDNKISIGLALLFVGQQVGGGTFVKDLRDGKFTRGKINPNKIAGIYNDFKEIFPDINMSFARALIFIIKSKQYDHEKDFDRFKKNKYDLQVCAKPTQYYRMFESILNQYRRGPKVRFGV